MYQNLINQNPMLVQFNNYKNQNPNVVPFQNNQLINNNVHVMNALTNRIQEQKCIQDQKLNSYNSSQQNNNFSEDYNKKYSGKSNLNIIQEMLKPVKINKTKNENNDVIPNYKQRNKIQSDAKKGKIGIAITNAAYKCIIKDRENINKKKVDDIHEEDLIVHKSVRGVDDDINIFKQQLKNKEDEKKEINAELEIEFTQENFDKHKKKFEFKETFIKNMVYEENTYDDCKQDFIEYYKKQRKEADERAKLIDKVTEYLKDDNLINVDELPGNSSNDEIADDVIENAVENNFGNNYGNIVEIDSRTNVYNTPDNTKDNLSKTKSTKRTKKIIIKKSSDPKTINKTKEKNSSDNIDPDPKPKNIIRIKKK